MVEHLCDPKDHYQPGGLVEKPCWWTRGGGERNGPGDRRNLRPVRAADSNARIGLGAEFSPWKLFGGARKPELESAAIYRFLRSVKFWIYNYCGLNLSIDLHQSPLPTIYTPQCKRYLGEGVNSRVEACRGSSCPNRWLVTCRLLQLNLGGSATKKRASIQDQAALLWANPTSPPRH